MKYQPTIYYRNSLTTKTIKQLKKDRAIYMKQHTDAMKDINNQYNKILSQLQDIREKELFVSGYLRNNTPREDQLATIKHKFKIYHNRVLKLSKFTPVRHTIIKKTIDKHNRGV